jgi:hypothetical protein
VTVTGDVAPNTTGDYTKTITSHYSINSSSSVVLSFDTFNDYIHYWSDPDPYSKNKFEGDFEWAFVEGDAKQMIFRGIKTDNKIIFTALETDIVSAMKGVFDTKNLVVDRLYKGYRWNGGEIELYEDGKLSGEMKKMKPSPFRGDEHPSLESSKDWWAIGYHTGVVGRGHKKGSTRKNYCVPCHHMYIYTLKNPNAKVKVVATDDKGRKYTCDYVIENADYSLAAPAEYKVTEVW